MVMKQLQVIQSTDKTFRILGIQQNILFYYMLLSLLVVSFGIKQAPLTLHVGLTMAYIIELLSYFH